MLLYMCAEVRLAFSREQRSKSGAGGRGVSGDDV